MHLMKYSQLVGAFLLVPLPLLTTQGWTQQNISENKVPENKPRKWTDQSGKYELVASIVAYEKGIVSLKKLSDGSVIKIDAKKLSHFDQSYLKVLFDEVGILHNSASPKKTSTNRVPTKNLPAKNAAEPHPKNIMRPAAVKNVAPNPNCVRCQGIGLIPFRTLSFVSQKEGTTTGIEKEPLGQCCPECQKGQDPLKYSDDSRQLVAEIEEFHTGLEASVGHKLKRYELRYRTVHSELADKETQVVLKAILALEQKLQKTFGHLLLSNSRRGQDDVVLVRQATYPKVVAHVRKDLVSREMAWDHLLTLHAFSIDRYSVALRLPDFPRSIVDKTVFTLATKQLGNATYWNEPPWLYSGFGAVMEHEVTRMNVVYVSAPPQYQSAQPIRDLRSDPKFAANWDGIFRQRARAGEARSWDTMFDLEINDYQLIHDLQAKSMVKFLLTKPEKFTNFVNNLSTTENKRQALADAYGVGPDELEKEWKKWVGFK